MNMFLKSLSVAALCSVDVVALNMDQANSRPKPINDAKLAQITDEAKEETLEEYNEAFQENEVKMKLVSRYNKFQDIAKQGKYSWLAEETNKLIRAMQMSLELKDLGLVEEDLTHDKTLLQNKLQEVIKMLEDKGLEGPIDEETNYAWLELKKLLDVEAQKMSKEFEPTLKKAEQIQWQFDDGRRRLLKKAQAQQEKKNRRWSQRCKRHCCCEWSLC